MIPRKELKARSKLGLYWLVREGLWFGLSAAPLFENPDLIDVDSDEYNPLVMANVMMTDTSAHASRYEASVDQLLRVHLVKLPGGSDMRISLKQDLVDYLMESRGFTLYEPANLWQRITRAGSNRDSRILNECWRQTLYDGDVLYGGTPVGPEAMNIVIRPSLDLSQGDAT